MSEGETVSVKMIATITRNRQLFTVIVDRSCNATDYIKRIAQQGIAHTGKMYPNLVWSSRENRDF